MPTPYPSYDELMAYAAEALEFQGELTKIMDKLDNVKSKIRGLANGEKMTLEVAGKGVVTVSQPRTSNTKTVTEFNEAALVNVPDLKKKLMEKGVLVEVVKTTPAAQASVSIKPNV